MDAIAAKRDECDSVIEHLKGEIGGLRTGRATPALVEDCSVEAYGTRQPLKAIASISVQDAKTLTIQPWDRSIVAAIESAIRADHRLGLNPINDGHTIRLHLPDLTAERRAELVKVLHTKLEQARIGLRKVREAIREEIEKEEEQKHISEDEKYRRFEGLDTLIKESNDRVKTIGEEKEKEILTI